MRKLALAFILVLLTFGLALGQETIRFQWEQEISPDLKAWELYESDTASFDCNEAGDSVATIEYTGQTEYTTTYQISGTEGQVLYFQLTASDMVGNESGCSNEVSYTIPDTTPPDVPFNLTVEVVVVPPSP